MPDLRRNLFLQSTNLEEINRVMMLLADRMDEMEGRRGTPTFYSSPDVQGNKIVNVNQGASTGEVLTADLEETDLEVSSSAKLRVKVSDSGGLERTTGGLAAKVQAGGGIAIDAAEGLYSESGGQAWPIGSVFLSVVSTNPNTLLGYGTWASFGTGRVLVGIDAGDADFDTVEETGGAKTSTPSAHAGSAVADHANHVHSGSATHADHTHTYTQVPNHVHVQSIPSSFTGSQSYLTQDTSTTGSTSSALSTQNPTGGVATGTTNAESPDLSHGNTGNNTTALTHSVTQPDAHAAMSVVQPYIVVYMWKRTA